METLNYYWNKDAVKVAAGGLLVPKSSDKDYMALTLANGLRVIVVSDQEADVAGAAMTVGVGSFSDPAELPGAFHFLEHLCFMGSKKYPDENGYSDFLQTHGGWSNAFTASEETVYFFEVASTGSGAENPLHKALDMFSGFFSCPLFSESGTARELEAVDSEHAKNLQSDMWRIYQLDRSTSKPGHVFNKFSTGNSTTLRDQPAAAGINVRDLILKLHKQHYSASRMTLSIVGKEPVSVLAEWASQLFSDISNNGSASSIISEHPYSDGHAQRFQHILPVRSMRRLAVQWEFPGEQGAAQLGRRSSSYLGHLLGHEGKGSLLSYLKAQGWASGLSAGLDSEESGFGTFGVTVTLTEEGLAAYEQVLAALYGYIGLLRAHGPQQWVYEEESKQAATNLRFKPRTSASDEAMMWSRNMRIFPSQLALVGERLFTAFQPAEISEMLCSYLLPERSIVRLVAQTPSMVAKCTEKEQWYGTQYSEEKFSPKQLGQMNGAMAAYEALARQRMSASGAADAVLAPAGEGAAGELAAWAAALSPPLSLPEANDFLATDFSLRHPQLRAKQLAEESGCCGGAHASSSHPVDAAAAPTQGAAPVPSTAGESSTAAALRARREAVPSLLREDDRCAVWHHLDDHFADPKVSLKAELDLLNCNSAQNAVLAALFSQLLRETLNEFSYSASLAGLHYNVGSTIKGGMAVELSGYNHKLHLLGEVVGKRMAAVEFSDLQFAIQKDALLQSLRNFSKEQPYSHASSFGSLALMTGRWSVLDRLAAVESEKCSAQALRDFLPTLLSNACLTVLVNGNATEEEALAMADCLLKPLLSVSAALPEGMRQAPRVADLPAPLAIAIPAGQDAASGGLSATLTFELQMSLPALNPEDPNSAQELIFMVGPGRILNDYRLSALVRLAGHLLYEPYFNVLRTQQQLGYIVTAGSSSHGSVQGLRFMVQSTRVDTPEELQRRTEAFIRHFLTVLDDMPVDKFAANVTSLSAKLLENAKSLGAETAEMQREVSEGTLDFQCRSREVQELQKLSKADLVQFFQEHVAEGGRRRRLFASLMQAGKKAEAGGASAGAGGAASTGGSRTQSEDDATALAAEVGNVDASAVQQAEEATQLAEADVAAAAVHEATVAAVAAAGAEPHTACELLTAAGEATGKVTGSALAKEAAATPILELSIEALSAALEEFKAAQAARGGSAAVITSWEELARLQAAVDEVAPGLNLLEALMQAAQQPATTSLAPAPAALRLRAKVTHYSSVTALLPLQPAYAKVRRLAKRAAAGGAAAAEAGSK